MTTIRIRGGTRMNGSCRNGNGYAVGQHKKSSSQRLLRCFVLSLVLYTVFIAVSVVRDRADTSDVAVGVGAGSKVAPDDSATASAAVANARMAAAAAVPNGKPRNLLDDTTGTPIAAGKKWKKTGFTLPSFEVAGVNLALYGIGDNNAANNKEVTPSFSTSSPYELFDDFNIGDKIKGGESWEELLSYRRKQRNINLAFYVDKVAMKRWLPTVDIPVPTQYYNRYSSEMPENDAFLRLGVESSVNEMIPREMSYVAKPSHLRHSDGVVLFRYLKPLDDPVVVEDDRGRVFIGRYNSNMKEVVDDMEQVSQKVARYIAKHFKERVAVGSDLDSYDEYFWALSQVTPGLVIEERITLWDDDMRPAMQFQLFVIFGRVYIARWVRGLSPWGLVNRDGKVVTWVGMPDNHPEVPNWVDWPKVIETAERVGANKDMIRVDIFVGVSADNLEVLDENASEKLRKDAVKIVVSDCDLSPELLELEQEPSIMHEAARLWISGYKTGNYKVVPNTEVPLEYRKTGKLSERLSKKNWIKTKFTLSKFESMGVNLAAYRMPPSEMDDIGENEEPFELYDNFNIAANITGNENWWDLVAYRRELDSPGLNFYVDKVAQKRWLPTIDMPTPRPFLCRYASEIPTPSANAGIPSNVKTIFTMLPQESNYAAKPSHTSCSDGVWLVKYVDGVTKVAAGGGIMNEVGDEALETIARSLATNLRKNPREMESIALKEVTHGFVVEERFTGLEADDRAAMEFKIFCFWGRVWIANWRRGHNRFGLLHRNGTVVDWVAKKEKHESLPDWVDWVRVIEIAEKLAQHKDMFRVDMFVGLPASSPALRDGVSEEEKKAAVEIVISEFEVHPTTKFLDPRLFEEASRLWIAGYKKLNIKTIPNNEIPRSFLETKEFSAPSESRVWVETRHTTKDFQVAGINLGRYRMEAGRNNAKETGLLKATEKPFELFEDFDISDKITGNEAWWDLVTIRISLKDKPALPFYNDKVALRRYLPSVGVPMPKSYALKYGTELSDTGKGTNEMIAVASMLPEDHDFVAKPSHSCFGDDVWLVKHHIEDGQKAVSVNGRVGSKRMGEDDNLDREEIGEALASTLHHPPGHYGSWVYDHIKPGVVVEERFAAIDHDRGPAVEFKVFTIWGKFYIAQWRQGGYSGIIDSDGGVVEWGSIKKKRKKLPDWVDWTMVKELAENMGRNKDMFRTDIFVGVPATSSALTGGATDEEKRNAVQVVVSEFELQPGTSNMDPGIFDDAARLWIAGYKMGNYKVVPNTEVPKQYVERGYLSEEDVAKAQERS